MIIKPVGREQVAVSNVVVGLTAALVKTLDGTHQRVIYAEIDVQDNDIYVTFDGTTPSATAGEKWYDSNKKRVWGVDNLLNIQFIRVTGDAVLEVTYWGN